MINDPHFTTRCMGDLGISVDGRTVALLFHRPDCKPNFHVYDLWATFPPSDAVPFDSLALALNHMQAIAARHLQEAA